MTEQNNFVVAWRGRGREPNIMARIFSVGGGLPALSINNVSHFEGDAGTQQYQFTVSTSQLHPSNINFEFSTQDDTATVANNDYEQATNVDAFIPANQPSTTITITVNGDATIETTEQFFVNLSNPSVGTIADGQGIGTIQDDDTPVIPVVSIDDISIAEGTGGTATAEFTISISAPIDEQITLNFQTNNGTAIAPDDFDDTDIPVVIPINTTTFLVEVDVVSDALQEGNETFTATLSNISVNATLGDSSATATIIDDECTYCDNFEDGILPNWVFKSVNLWLEDNDVLVGSPTGSGAIDGIASPAFPDGCSNCAVKASLMSSASSNGIVTLIGWFVDSKTKVELQMKEGKDKWSFRQKVNGNTVAKKSFSQTIDPDTMYLAEVRWDGTLFHVLIDGIEIMTINGSGSPNGTVGISVKRAVGTADHITVVP
jgi:hypothetical protein